MKYSDLVKQMAQNLGLSQSEADKYLKTFMQTVIDSLKTNDSVDLAGLGKFKKVPRKARTGINPKTLEKINIPASISVKFQAAAAVKRAFNG